jgi:hypothetical protein
MYDSPKQIRRRQQARNDAPRKRTRKPSPIKVSSQEEWDRTCDFSLTCLHTQAEQGHADAAGRHAQAIVHMAVYRRALQIMRDDHRSYFGAMKDAMRELYGEVDQ